jgi:predicted aspartyl protease
MRWRFSCLFTVAAAFVAIPALAQNECPPRPIVTLPLMVVDGGRVAVATTIAEHPIRLEVDTGASDSLLSEQAAESLGLERTQITDRKFQVLSGAAVHEYVIASDIAIGSLKIDRMKFALLPNNTTGKDIDGLLGFDVLSHFDIEFDFAQHKMVLYKQSACGVDAVNWLHKSDVAVIPFKIELTHIVFPAVLDGKQIVARLDTGSWQINLSLEAAESLYGLSETSPDMQPIGNSNNPRAGYLHTFGELSFGGKTFQNVRVRLMHDNSTQLPDGPRLHLGMPILRTLHLYIAYGERKLYFSLTDKP